MNKKIIILIYLAVAFSTTICHDWFIDWRLQEIRKTLHEQVINHQAPAPIQYRILIHYLAEFLIKLGIPFRESYLFIRVLFTFLSAYLFHNFLSIWFNPIISICGVLYLLAVLPLTYIRYYMQPMDLPNLFFFLCGYLVISKRKDFLLLPVIIVGMLNRETTILLVLVYLFFRWDELKLSKLFLRTGIMFISGMAIYIGLRYIFSIRSYYSDLYYLDFNLTDIRTYFYALCLFGPFAFLSFYKFNEKPKFLRRAILMIPFFVIIHYTMTIMIEPRLWLPILPLIVASGLFSITPKEFKKSHIENAKISSPKNYSKFSYFMFLGMFLIFFVGFFRYYQELHLKNRNTEKIIENILAESSRYKYAGWYQRAIEELKRGLIFQPENAELHYQLGLIYAYNLNQPEKAIEHFQKCLKYNPYHLYRDQIKNEIQRLEYYCRREKSPT